jgi:hypothetical protein
LEPTWYDSMKVRVDAQVNDGARALDRALAQILDRERALDIALNKAVANARLLVRDLALEHARSFGASRHSGRQHDLADALVRARELRNSIVGTRVRALVHDRDRGRALIAALEDDGMRAHALVRDIKLAHANTLVRVLSTALANANALDRALKYRSDLIHGFAAAMNEAREREISNQLGEETMPRWDTTPIAGLLGRVARFLPVDHRARFVEEHCGGLAASDSQWERVIYVIDLVFTMPQLAWTFRRASRTRTW